MHNTYVRTINMSSKGFTGLLFPLIGLVGFVFGFLISLSKRCTYKASVNFAGDNTYAASSKSVKITIN